VDFWDLTKLLFQRWYFALPMLVLTAFASMWILTNVQPSYIATAHVQLVPPITQATKPGDPAIDRRNPWFDLGLSSLANAAMVTVQDEAVVVALEEGGYSGTYTVALGSWSPLVTFEVTGSTPAQTSATADQLVRRYNQSVLELQRDYGVEQPDVITTRRLDLGTSLTESDARVKRALVGVAGAGLLMTIAWTVGLDAVIRRRARRRAGLAATELPPAVTPADRPATPGFDRRVLVNRPGSPDVTPAVSMIPNLSSAAAIVTGNGTGGGAGVTVIYHTSPTVKTHSPAPADPAAPPEGPTAVTVISSDETVVLPLSAGMTRRREQARSEDSQPR